MRQLRSTPSGLLTHSALLDDPRLRRVLDVLNPTGEETRLVGGAVRNALLGLPPGDIDLATTMPPDDTMRRAKAAKLRAIPTGIDHGTVTVMSGSHPFEVTTLREDIETDGRHAVVRFGRDFFRDAERRDFTMNALSLGPDGEIFDTVGGLDDLAQGRVRFIGDAATRIREDFLRILRFFRFHASYGLGPLDTEGLLAAQSQRDGLARLSRERVRAEVFKILAAPGALGVLRVMHDVGVLSSIIPGRLDLDRLERLILCETQGPDATLRLAALAAEDPAGLETLRDSLRLTNAETKRLDAASNAARDLDEAPSEARLRRLVFDHGREASIDALRLRQAGGGARSDDDALAFLASSPIPVFPFSSADLMRRGFKGPALGRALARLGQCWADEDFPTDPSVLEALLDQASS